MVVDVALTRWEKLIALPQSLSWILWAVGHFAAEKRKAERGGRKGTEGVGNHLRNKFLVSVLVIRRADSRQTGL